MAACRGSSIIRLDDAQRAVVLLDSIEPEMKKIFGVKDISRQPDAVMQLLDYIPYSGIFEDELIRKMLAFGQVFPKNINMLVALQTLEAAKLIVTCQKDGRMHLTRLRNPDESTQT